MSDYSPVSGGLNVDAAKALEAEYGRLQPIAISRLQELEIDPELWLLVASVEPRLDLWADAMSLSELLDRMRRVGDWMEARLPGLRESVRQANTVGVN